MMLSMSSCVAGTLGTPHSRGAALGADVGTIVGAAVGATLGADVTAVGASVSVVPSTAHVCANANVNVCAGVRGKCVFVPILVHVHIRCINNDERSPMSTAAVGRARTDKAPLSWSDKTRAMVM